MTEGVEAEGVGRVRWIVVRIVRLRFGGAIRWLERNYTKEEDGGVEDTGLRLYAKLGRNSLRG